MRMGNTFKSRLIHFPIISSILERLWSIPNVLHTYALPGLRISRPAVEDPMGFNSLLRIRTFKEKRGQQRRAKSNRLIGNSRAMSSSPPRFKRPSFYCCYLLRSLSKRETTYIGSTPDPPRVHNISCLIDN